MVWRHRADGLYQDDNEDKAVKPPKNLPGLISADELENLKRIFDAPIETDEDLLELAKLTEDESNEDTTNDTDGFDGDVWPEHIRSD
jgi:hypothetical protein